MLKCYCTSDCEGRCSRCLQQPDGFTALGRRNRVWVSKRVALTTEALPQAAVGEDSIQIWKAAANILNNMRQTADKEWPSSLGLCNVLTSPHREGLTYYELYHKTWDLCRSFGTTIERAWSGLIWLRVGTSGRFL